MGDTVGKTSTATKNKWNASNYDQLRVNVKKGEKEIYMQLAKEQGKSLNGLINELLQNELEQQKKAEE